MQGLLITVAIALVSVMLHGCDYTATQTYCEGGSCTCDLDFHDMEAGIFIGGTPIEHASRHVSVGDFQRSSDSNISACCTGLSKLYSEQIHGKTSTIAKDTFCAECKDAPNPTLAAAAATCASTSTEGSQARFLFQRDSQDDLDAGYASSVAQPPAGISFTYSDYSNYSDCNIEYSGTDAKVIVNGVHLDKVRSTFRIRWTDTSRIVQPCCEALRPVIRALYVDEVKVPESQKQAFCAACKGAYNTGVALAAYRWCA